MKRGDASKRFVYARLAYQWKDDKGNPRRALPKDLKEQLRSICEEVCVKIGESRYSVDFASLRGEAGTYLLRKIIVDIMSADILFFDLTYKNPNVFFELGVAYTMGRRFFLIVRQDKTDDVPSDLNGLTISPYQETLRFSNSSTLHDVKRVLREAIKKKIQLNQ